MYKINLFIIAFLISHFSYSNSFSGRVNDLDSGKDISYAYVMISELRKSSITDENGAFLFQDLEEGKYTLEISLIGYHKKAIQIEIPYTSDIPFVIGLQQTDFGLDEIVISTSPAGTGFRYQPNQAFSGEKLERMQDVSLGTMLDGQPGVASHSLGTAPTRPVLRGLDGDRVLVLENGERMGDLSSTAHDHVVSLEPLATQKIEIVRGPAGLLFGSSAIGGVVNLITNDIPQKWKKGPSLSFHGQAATVNSMYAGMLDYTQGFENFALKGRVSYRNSGELNTPEGILPGTQLENIEAVAGMGFKKNYTSGGLSFQFVDMVYGIPESIDDPDQLVEIRLNKQSLQTALNFEREGFFDKIEWRINSGRFFQQEVEIEIEPDGERDEEVELEFLQYSVSSTLSAQHKPFAIFDRGAFGVNIFGRSLSVGGDDAFTPGYRTLNMAFYVFEEIPLGRKVRLQSGFRIDYSLNSTIANEQFEDINETNNYLNFSTSLGINYKPNPNIEIGAQGARAFRNPSLEELYANGPHLGAGVYEIGNPDIKVETAYGSDFFIIWRNKFVRIEATAFINQINNFIAFSPTGVIDTASGLPVFRYFQEKAVLKGGEISAAFMMSKSFSAGIFFDYVHGNFIGEETTPLPFMPPFRTGVNLTYEHKAFWIGADSRFVAEQSRVAPDEESTPQYVLIGLNTGYRLDFHGNHLFMLRVQNLLNTSYRDHLSRVFERENPMPGRNFLFSYRYKF